MKKIALLTGMTVMLVLVAFPQVHTGIHIISPGNLSHVPQNNNTIEFSGPRSAPPGTKFVVFIKDPLGGFWPYTNSDYAENNKWKLEDAQIGIAKDRDKHFEITVLAVDENKIDSGEVENSTPLNRRQFNQLYNDNPHSQTVTVIRL